MNRYARRVLIVAGLAALCGGAEALAQVPVETNTQQEQVHEWAMECAKECTAVLERWIVKETFTKKQLFSFLYYPLPNTSPPKFSTDYDTRSDKEIQPILERYLSKSENLIYVIMVDRNGYVPTHNLKFSATLTGNLEKDAKQSLTKRLLDDRVGLTAARSQAPHLLQHFTDDEGQELMELSVPLQIDNEHWGAIRVGYRSAAPEEQPAP